MLEDYTPYQQGIIKRYYRQLDAIQIQRLSELVTELYLADEGKQKRLWKSVEAALTKLKVPASRIEHLLKRRDAALLAQLVKELTG